MDSEDTNATNELINDGQFVQPLTSAEIEDLKQSGVHATVTIHILHLALNTEFKALAGNCQETDRNARKLFAQD